MTVTRCCRQAVVKRFEVWCPVHGSQSVGLVDHGAVEEPSPIRRRDLAAQTGRHWTEEEKAWVLANKDRMSHQEMADALGRTVRGLYTFLSKSKIRKRRIARTRRAKPVARSRQPWTDDELAELEDTGSVSNTTSRSWRSMREKALRSGLGSLCRADGMLSLRGVARLYGCPLSRVERLVRTKRLPATKARWGTWRIDPQDCEAIRRDLVAAKRTWQQDKPNTGERIGYRQVRVNGRPRWVREDVA